MAVGACKDCGCALEECECREVEPRLRKTSTPWQRIMRAAKRGTGCRLSAEEVRKMSIDHAVSEAASEDDERED